MASSREEKARASAPGPGRGQAPKDLLDVLIAAMGLPGVERSTSYGTASLKVDGRFLARLKDADTLVVRCPLEEKAFLIEAEPAVYFETDHYKGHAAILVRLSEASDEALQGRIERAWRMQAARRRVTAYDSSIHCPAAPVRPAGPG